MWITTDQWILNLNQIVAIIVIEDEKMDKRARKMVSEWAIVARGTVDVELFRDRDEKAVEEFMRSLSRRIEKEGDHEEAGH